MPQIKTYGRSPTLGEVKEYYARADVLAFLNYACKKRKVIFSFKDEPSLRSEAHTSPLEPQNIEHLRQIIMEGVEDKMRGMADDARPHAYPSFHGMTDKDGDTISDFVMEADCQGWRRSFVDVRGAIEILNNFHVPYIAKFSGHRSLHVMIPREAFPEEFDGAPIDQSWKSLVSNLRSFFGEYAKVRYAHGTGGILRLPYSLNENTGMVSLPIGYEELDDFRPWEAIIHLVGEIKPDLFHVSAGDRNSTSQFLHAALIEKRIKPLKGKMWCIRPKRDLDKYQYLLNDLSSEQTQFASDDPIQQTEAALRLMISGSRVPDEVFMGYGSERSVDARWFIAEALMGDERASELLHESDEYAGDAIGDSVSLNAGSFLKHLLNRDMDWSSFFDSAVTIHGILERSSRSLKGEIIQQAEVVHEDKSLLILKCASALGGADGDWDTVSEVAAMLERRFPWRTDIIPQYVCDNIKLLAIPGWQRESEKRMAAEALIAAGERATDALMLAMANPDLWMRKGIMSILCKVGDPKAVPCLVSALGDPGGKVRRMAVGGIMNLKQKPEELKQMLIEAAESDNPRMRANAMTVLRLIDDTALDSLEVALRSLEDTDPKVRKAGVKSLGKIGGSRAINGLLRALADENNDVSITAAFALTDAGDKGMAELQTAMISDNLHIARCAAHALAKVGDFSGIDLVMDALHDDEWQVWGTPQTLAESGDKRAVEALMKLVEDSIYAESLSSKAINATKALGRCADERALDILKAMMYTRRDRNSRRAAVMALREMGTDEALNVLLEAMISKDGNLTQHAGNALAKMGTEILPRLKALADQAEGKQRRRIENVMRLANARAG